MVLKGVGKKRNHDYFELNLDLKNKNIYIDINGRLLLKLEFVQYLWELLGCI